MSSHINIRNKKAWFNYEIIDRFIAGIQLKGTEIKSLRLGKVSLAESYCAFTNNELFVHNMSIAEYSHRGYVSHDPMQYRKLLMNRKELNKLEKKVKEKGFTIVVLRVFINDRGLAKIEIALGRGKREYDKRESLKNKDAKRDLDRLKRH